jgi:hypothetical protein
MAQTWETKYGRRRVKHEPPTIAEAIVAAEGLTDDLEEQVRIAAGLLNVSVEAVKGEAGRSEPMRGAAARGETRRRQPQQGPRGVVVVQRKRRVLGAMR